MLIVAPAAMLVCTIISTAAFGLKSGGTWRPSIEVVTPMQLSVVCCSCQHGSFFAAAKSWHRSSLAVLVKVDLHARTSSAPHKCC